MLFGFPTRLFWMLVRSKGRTFDSLARRVKEQVCLEKGPPLRNQASETGKHSHWRVDFLLRLAEAGDFKVTIRLTSFENNMANLIVLLTLHYCESTPSLSHTHAFILCFQLLSPS